MKKADALTRTESVGHSAGARVRDGAAVGRTGRAGLGLCAVSTVPEDDAIGVGSRRGVRDSGESEDDVGGE